MLDAMTVIRQHVLIGVGPAQVSGEFIGDSQIINALHDGGVLNALCYGLFYLWLFLSALKKQDYSRALMVVCLGLSCLSLPVFTYACTIPLVGYCITMDDKNLLFFRERKAPDTDSSVE